MPSCADVLAAALRDAGVERMFGLPGISRSRRN